MIDLVRFATLAPSGHNTQPWRFSLQADAIRIFPDFTRCLPVVDPDDHALYVSLGCALENLIIAANNAGYETDISYFPASEPKECLVVHLREGGKAADSMFFDAIPERQSSRCAYDGKPVPPEHLRKLEEASRQEGVVFRLFIQPEEIEPIIGFVKEGNHVQFTDKAFMQELVSWIRFSKRETEKHQDGLTGAAMGSPSVPRWLGKLFFRLGASPRRQASLCETMIRSSSALMMFIARKNEKDYWVQVGQSFQRVALAATSLNIKMAHLNMPCEVVSLRRKLAKHLSIGDAQPLLLLRIGYAAPMPRSPRRPVEQVLENANGAGAD